MTKIDLAGLEITDGDLRQIVEAWEADFLKLKHPYVFDLIKALAPSPHLRRTIALGLLRSTRTRLGLPIPPTFDETAQHSLEYYCLDSDVFKKRRAPTSEALFCWPAGKGKGIWALIHDNARVWVRKNRELLPERAIRKI
jgi:hypothetical protein